ncbi:MAG: dihydrodipicolinate synthase family protein, partial [Pirellulales bacterium]
MHKLSDDQYGLSRRAFLKLTGMAAAVAAVPSMAVASAPGQEQLKRPLDPQEFKKHLAGPILSLPTTFKEDLTVNHAAVHQMIGRAIKYGVPIFGLTAGNSKYQCLEYDEIKAVTRSMVEAADGKGLTIAATGPWPTEQVIDYARYSQAHGADSIQILRPEGVEDEKQLFEHFLAISKSTSLPTVLHGVYSLPLLRRLAEIESIVAMKEDGELTYYIDRIIEFGDRFEIFSGGAENRFLVGYPYGARAFFSTYTGFAPDKPMLFWEAIRSDDLKRAVTLTTTYDYPFIRRFTHPFWHATLEYFGVAKRYMRKPFETLPDNQLAEVKAFFDGQGI